MSDKLKKFIDSLDEKFRIALKGKLEELRKDPYKMKGIIKMKGTADVYRLRIGKVRIVYIILENKDIAVIDIDYRGNIY